MLWPIIITISMFLGFIFVIVIKLTKSKFYKMFAKISAYICFCCVLIIISSIAIMYIFSTDIVDLKDIPGIYKCEYEDGYEIIILKDNNICIQKYKGYKSNEYINNTAKWKYEKNINKVVLFDAMDFIMSKNESMKIKGIIELTPIYTGNILMLRISEVDNLYFKKVIDQK